MSKTYSAMVQDILAKWLASLKKRERSKTQMDPEIIRGIELLVKDGEIGNYKKILALITEESKWGKSS